MTKNNTYKFFTKAAILMSCFFVCSCENSMQELNDMAKGKTHADVAENVTSYMSQAGLVKAKLTAPIMTRSEADTPIVEFPNTLQVEFFNDSSKQESHLFAKYGKYFERAGKVYLRDSVIVYNLEKGDTLITNELWWDRNKEIFYNSKPVLIKQANNQNFKGDSITADQDFTAYTLFNGSGIRNIPDSSLPQ